MGTPRSFHACGVFQDTTGQQVSKKLCRCKQCTVSGVSGNSRFPQFPGIPASNFPSLPVGNFFNSRSHPVKQECDFHFPFPGALPAYPCTVLMSSFIPGEWRIMLHLNINLNSKHLGSPRHWGICAAIFSSCTENLHLQYRGNSKNHESAVCQKLKRYKLEI